MFRCVHLACIVQWFLWKQVVPSGVDVKWNMYKCFVALKDYQEAFDIVSNDEFVLCLCINLFVSSLSFSSQVFL